MIQVIFTRSNKPVSRAIRYLTDEPVSHVAIRWHNAIIHSSFLGVEMITFDEFKSQGNEVVFSIGINSSISSRLLNKYAEYRHGFYDYFSIFYLFFRYLFKKFLRLSLPKVNLWAVSGMFTCTDWVSYIVNGKENPEITPYGLYQKLKGDVK